MESPLPPELGNSEPRGFWKSSFKWPILVLLASLLWAALAFAHGAYSAWRDHKKAVADVVEKVERLRTNGEPISKAELQVLREKSGDGPNSTEAWLTAMNSLDTDQFEADGIELPFVGKGKFARLNPEAEDSLLNEALLFLSNYESTLNLAISASQQPGKPRFPIEIDEEDAFLLCEDKVRCLERLLRLSTHVRAIQDNS